MLPEQTAELGSENRSALFFRPGLPYPAENARGLFSCARARAASIRVPCVSAGWRTGPPGRHTLLPGRGLLVKTRF